MLQDEKASGIQVTVDSWFMQSVMKDLSALRVTANTMRGVAEVSQRRMDEMQVSFGNRTGIVLKGEGWGLLYVGTQPIGW